MPAQALRIDLNNGPVVSGLRFTPRAVFLYSAMCPGFSGLNHGNNSPGTNGGRLAFGFAHDGAGGSPDAAYSHVAFDAPVIFIVALGNSGAQRSADHSGSVLPALSISSWDECGFTFSDDPDLAIGGIAFGSEESEYAIGEVTLPNDGSDATVSGLDFQPDFIILARAYDGIAAPGAAGEIWQGLGVSNGSEHWFHGYVNPQLDDPTHYSRRSWTQNFQDGCACLSAPLLAEPARVYDAAMTSDGFVLSAIGGAAAVPTGAIDTEYLFMAIKDPDGTFDIGTLQVTGGGTYGVSGINPPDALFISRNSRNPDVEEEAQELPAPPGFVDETGILNVWNCGSSDRFPPAFGYSNGDPSAVIGLRVDESNADGVYGAVAAGTALLFTFVGGTIGTFIDSATSVDLFEGDVVRLICDGDDVELWVAGVLVCSGTQTDVSGPGRLLMLTISAGTSYDSVRCGTIGAPPLIDNFTGPDALDIGAPWIAAPGVFGGGVNMSRGKNMMVASDVEGVHDASDQASYLDGVTFTDAEALVVVGPQLFWDDEHNVHSTYNCSWSGFGHFAWRRMDGFSADTKINEDADLILPGTYPTGPYLDVDADRGGGFGVTADGWQGDVFSDDGNHTIGWFTVKMGTSIGSGPCGFPTRRLRRRTVPGTGMTA